MLRSRDKAIGAGVIALAVLLIVIGYGWNYEMARQQLQAKVHVLTRGDPARGKQLVQAYGCGGCHTIPQVPQAAGLVGPSLSGIGGRVYIAGRLENRPENLERWIQNPRAVDPQTAMPYLGVTPAQARDIAAFLYTLN